MVRRKVLVLRSDTFGWSDLVAALQARDDVDVAAVVRGAGALCDLAREHQPAHIFAPATINWVSTYPEISAILQEQSPNRRISIFAAYLYRDQFLQFIRLGISAYILWPDIAASALDALIETLLSSDVLMFSDEPARAWRQLLGGQILMPVDPPQLTRRELQVLQRLAEGKTREEITLAEQISLTTVKRTIATLQIKLDAENQFTLGMNAARLGLISH